MDRHELPQTKQINLLRAETAMILRNEALAQAAKLAQGRSEDRGRAKDVKRACAKPETQRIKGIGSP